MPIEFVACVAGVDDEYCMVAAVGERDDGTGRALIFQAGDEPPDAQDIQLGMDTYCLVTEPHGTAYGCVRELSIDGDRMRVVVGEDALADLHLEDAEIVVELAADTQTLATFREYLARILTYGATRRAAGSTAPLTTAERKPHDDRLRGSRL
ncbi:Imm10 family immunity protein [Dactylosporangium sp. McL0621]|uniref:Imm10 family immunity protein n=1 Tax=Dactylosporangium sp. McL0621 TaxID=3415678 RepID=UPI003CF9818F